MAEAHNYRSSPRVLRSRPSTTLAAHQRSTASRPRRSSEITSNSRARKASLASPRSVADWLGAVRMRAVGRGAPPPKSEGIARLLTHTVPAAAYG